MSNESLQVLNAAIKLSERDRAELAAQLIASLDTDKDANWANTWDDEIERRLAELDAGKPTIPWSKARAIISGDADVAGQH